VEKHVAAKGKAETGHNSLAKGLSLKLIYEIMGLDMKTIKSLKTQCEMV